ncbi:MAG: SDR family oxidoreductase [Prevotellaceae bacterium]|jgi:NAD(P)-dependent dehydrogenase (short-subunit alcohol dehydrogenase family)|nr:SDR family oxidoreductase [Prevotellaceae bacterium]
MQQKVILITGASSGFGKAVAERLLADGHIVYGTSRKPNADGINQLKMLQMNVSSRQQIKAAVEKILQAENRIDVLINNAGMGISGAVEMATEEEIAVQMGTNFFGAVNVCSAVLPHFRERRKGLIINVSSIGGVFAIPYQGFYSASKFAVEGYSEALSLETRQFGINTVIIEPGDFHTGFTKSRVISQKTLENSDYQKSFERVLKNVEKDEINGGKPEYLAKKISKIVNSKHPKLRYVITPIPLQKLSVLLSHLLSGRAFQWVIRLFYSV